MLARSISHQALKISTRGVHVEARIASLGITLPDPTGDITFTSTPHGQLQNQREIIFLMFEVATQSFSQVFNLSLLACLINSQYFCRTSSSKD
jgi:hypothetical protein